MIRDNHRAKVMLASTIPPVPNNKTMVFLIRNRMFLAVCNGAGVVLKGARYRKICDLRLSATPELPRGGEYSSVALD